MLRLLSILLIASAFAGCLEDTPTSNEVEAITPGIDLDVPLFSQPILIDELRAGGEPVIAVTQEGTILVAAHPGWTHYHPSEDPSHPGSELLQPASGQSYLWRSTDGGDSWTHIGLPGQEEGPRSSGGGVSDPDFTVMEDQAICYTDLMALATSSVVCSQDDGETWLPGNEFASGGPNDRQWLASSGPELYFTANYFADHHIRASTDHGLTWEDRGNVPCSHDLVANPHTGHLIVGCESGIAVSEDNGWNWETRSAGGGGGQRIMAEPAVDGAGNIWMVFVSGERNVWVKGSPDEGDSWPWHVNVTEPYKDAVGGEGTYVWPWISAGSEGRFAVTWIGTTHAENSAENFGPWYLESVLVHNATTEPVMQYARLSPDPIHEAPICQSGTVCQVESMQGNDAGDRRLGDFFETTIDHDGFLHAVVSNTADKPDDVVSHVLYVRQTGGEPLIAAGDDWAPTQG